MIAVTFALPAESSEFVRLIRNGQLHGREVRVLHTGVGGRLASKRVQDFLEQTSPRLVISAGFAGALTHDLHVGDLIADEKLCHPAIQSLPNVRIGKLVTVDAVIDSLEERTELARRSGAMATDMETESIARICKARGVPVLSLRAISDTPAAPFAIPSSVLFDVESQRTKIARLAGYLVRHPSAIGRLLAIARQVKIARRSLSSALDLLLRSDALSPGALH